MYSVIYFGGLVEPADSTQKILERVLLFVMLKKFVILRRFLLS